MMMERGSKYEVYANLRESRLRMKQTSKSLPLPPENQTRSKKQVRVQGQKSFHVTTSQPEIKRPPVKKNATPGTKSCSKFGGCKSSSEKTKSGLLTAMQIWMK